MDEFQDTSAMQWNNIIPLIDHALSSETQRDQTAGLTLVGDAKQSIYRFRGGKAEQFIDLYNGQSPFSIKEKVTNLPYNYRSAKEIVEFNNSFFSYISSKFNKPSYRELFENSGQQPKKETTGYINISFLETENAEHEMELHPAKVYEIIQNLEEQGTNKSDICVLTRTRKQSFAVANYLNDQGISIVSSESLLVANSPQVLFINDLLEFSINPDDRNLRWSILNYLVKELKVSEPHQLIVATLDQKEKYFFEWLNKFGITFKLQEIRELSLYEAAEYIIRSFSLIKSSDAYLQAYLDFIFEKSTKAAISVTTFLEYWDQYSEKLSIVAPKTNDAVQIMTIHTSKGLEFPVVIYPFANSRIKDISKEYLWLPLPEDLADIPVSYFKASKKMLDWGNYAAEAYQNLLDQTEFDAINILYVALTRASQQLYILSCYEFKNGQECEDKVSGLLIGYLKSQNKWSGEKTYEIGENLPVKGRGFFGKALHPQEFYSSPTQNQIVKIVTLSGKLWGSTQEEAINTVFLYTIFFLKLLLLKIFPKR
ncbi:UvrD-helicase domain-containing protein [Antarcticibacterium sp. 1MA-6-2]|uniref:UvrD-helicase domain-containing protein n=1 Tax=Antarcticibacterium sp. 1MA-6-2 TaxID=2908210 RepID=UPI001F2A6B9E|nr:3'-5' exonuclease [Antarcticibacterium sp. 1MA-6-2]UJH92993.1 UvrD-helicase domain-containing protein [Antarcticibacterium sp. 1MA-6-2]